MCVLFFVVFVCLCVALRGMRVFSLACLFCVLCFFASRVFMTERHVFAGVDGFAVLSSVDPCFFFF